MAADPDNLDLIIAASTHKDLLAIVEDERKQRKVLLEMVRPSEVCSNQIGT